VRLTATWEALPWLLLSGAPDAPIWRSADKHGQITHALRYKPFCSLLCASMGMSAALNTSPLKYA